MGELLRNLHPVTLGKEELMIELNAGGNKKTGRIIHIQNKDFRLEMREKDFLRLSATILRAKSEMDYIKSREKGKKYGISKSSIAAAGDAEENVIKHVADILDKNGVEYRLVEKREGLVTLIADPKKKKQIRKVLKKDRKIHKKIHPDSPLFGYRYLYKMEPFEMYRLNGIYLQIYYRLPCLSLTEKTWIPLDRAIQERVWSCSGKAEGYNMLDEISLYIYRLCKVIFKQKTFSDADIAFFEENRKLKDEAELKRLLEKVFFSYTDRLLSMIDEGKYEEIIADYLAYY